MINSRVSLDKTSHYDDNLSINEQKKNLGKNFILKISIDILIIIIIFVAYILVYFYYKPNLVYLTCYDNDIIYPFKNETIYFWVVILYGLLGPIFLIVLIELKYSIRLNSNNRYNSFAIFKFFLINLYQSLSLFILGVSVVLLLTDILKKWIGRLRPHFLDICKPNLAIINCNRLAQIGYFQQSIYTGNSFCSSLSNSTDLSQARLSFPSAHSSFSSYTMLFLIIYLEIRLNLTTLKYFKYLIQLVALIVAVITSISRIYDYYSRPSDVIAGCLLGILIALFIQFQIGKCH